MSKNKKNPEREHFLSIIKNLIDDENGTVVKEGYLEEIIFIPYFYFNKEFSYKINIENTNWEIKLYNSGNDILVDFKKPDFNTSAYKYVHIPVKVVLYARNITDYNCYKYIVSPFYIYDRSRNWKKINFLKISELIDTENNIVNFNKCIFGAYVRIYSYNKRFFIENLKLMKSNNEINVMDDSEEWPMKFSDFKKNKTLNYKISDQERVLTITPYKINYNYLLNINFDDWNSNLDKMYIDHNRIVYIRKCSDYSKFYYVECNSQNKASIEINSSLKSEIFEKNKVIIGIYHQYSYNLKRIFLNTLKSFIKDDQYIPESEGSFEWKIENWNQLSHVESSSEFTIGDHKWKLELYPSGLGETNRDSVSVNLKNIDDNFDNSTHIFIKKIIYIRNYNDFTCYQLKDDELFYFFNTICKVSYTNILNHEELYIERGNNGKSIIENNKCVIGIYIRVYKYNAELYKDEITHSIDNENHLVQSDEFFEMKIENWNNISHEILSPTFYVDNYQWMISICPNRNNNDNQNFVNFKIQNLDIVNNNSYICAKVIFFIKTVNDSCFTMKSFPTFINFTKNNVCYGTEIIENQSLITKNKNDSFLENNQRIVGVYLRTYKKEYGYNGMNYIERSIEYNNEIENQWKSFEQLPKAMEQFENYEYLLKEIKNYKNIIHEKEECEKELENMKERVKELEEKLNKNHNHITTPTLVIAKYDFYAYEYDQLDIRKDEFLMVTDWDYEEGWVFGHRKDNKYENGIFPKIFISIYNENENDNELSNPQGHITPEYRLEFEKKIKKFRNLKGMKMIFKENRISINRNKLFEDAFNSISKLSKNDLKKNLKISYVGESGIDAGGLLRDFFYQISKEIGNPNYALFQYSSSNSYELEINPKSNMANPFDLLYFKFTGRIMGLAIFLKQYIPLSFTLLFYKNLLEIEPEFSDLKYVDSDMYKNLNWLKENKGVENLYLTFEMEEDDCFGNHKKVNLKPNGANIDVTDENKYEYIDLIVKHKLNNTGGERQFKALKEGFYEIIPEEIKKILNEFDLKYLLSGINEINVEDWEKNTDYDGYNKNDITIINFWKCVKELNADKRTQLLLFATGNSQVPITGFKDLQGSGKIQHFKLKKTGNENDFPVSHTCFNRIDLPPYTSYTHLKQKLLRAITEGMEGFQRE